MKEVDTGREKVKKICDVLRKETLEPAKQEAEEIVRQAKLQAEQILKSAREEADAIHKQAVKEIERQEMVFTTSLHQAGKQMMASLRNEIERKLFNPALDQMLKAPLADPKVVVHLIEAVVEAVKKEGTNADLDICIPSKVSVEEVNSQVLKLIGKDLASCSISLGPIEGGITVKLVQENIMIDISDQALKEWICKYIRQEFRKVLFEAK